MISSLLVPTTAALDTDSFVEVADAELANLLGEGFLSASRRPAEHQPTRPIPTTTAAAVNRMGQVRFGDSSFFLGVNHLLTGYDHLLFLGGLLIVCRSLLKAFQMLTLFHQLRIRSP